MKILYAIQGTGNGHVSRAMDVAPALEKHGQVDYMISGAQVEIAFPYEITYKSKGLGFYFGKSGGVNMSKTFIKNSTKRVYREVRDFPIEKYDLIINDFEPITAWAARIKNKKCVALSHQCALLSDLCPKPQSANPVGKLIINNYAPASTYYGFHFDEIDQNIFTPVVRKAIRERDTADDGHYTVYLPSYADEKILSVLTRIPQVKWQVFSKHTSRSYKCENVEIMTINNKDFIHSLSTCTGILCGAGFETPSEALYLNKKLMVIPMKNQYEQQCNAEALRLMGVPVMKKLKMKSADKIKHWIESDQKIHINYPDKTEEIIANVVINEM